LSQIQHVKQTWMFAKVYSSPKDSQLRLKKDYIAS